MLFGTVAICTFSLRLRYARLLDKAVAGTKNFDQVLLRPQNAFVLVSSEVHDHLYDDETTAEEGVVPTMEWVSYKDSPNSADLHRRDLITE